MTLERDEFVGRWRIVLHSELWWHRRGAQWTWRLERRWNRIGSSGRVPETETWNFLGISSKREAEAKFEEVVRETAIAEACAALYLEP